LSKQQVIGGIGQFTVPIIFRFIQTEDLGAKTSVLCMKSFVQSVFPKLICDIRIQNIFRFSTPLTGRINDFKPKNLRKPDLRRISYCLRNVYNQGKLNLK